MNKEGLLEIINDPGATPKQKHDAQSLLDHMEVVLEFGGSDPMLVALREQYHTKWHADLTAGVQGAREALINSRHNWPDCSVCAAMRERQI